MTNPPLLLVTDHRLYLKMADCYSADKLSEGSRKKQLPGIRGIVSYNGKDYTCVGVTWGSWCLGTPTRVSLIEIFPENTKLPETDVSTAYYAYHGVTVNFRGKNYLLGNYTEARYNDFNIWMVIPFLQ